MFTVGGAQFTLGGAVFKRRSQVYSRRSHVYSRSSLFIVGGAHEGAVGPPNWYWGRFFGGHSYFLGVSNDFSGKKGPNRSVSVPLRTSLPH